MTSKNTSNLGLLVLSVLAFINRRTEQSRKRIEKQYLIQTAWIKRVVEFLRDFDSILHRRKTNN